MGSTQGSEAFENTTFIPLMPRYEKMEAIKDVSKINKVIISKPDIQMTIKRSSRFGLKSKSPKSKLLTGLVHVGPNNDLYMIDDSKRIRGLSIDVQSYINFREKTKPELTLSLKKPDNEIREEIIKRMIKLLI